MHQGCEGVSSATAVCGGEQGVKGEKVVRAHPVSLVLGDDLASARSSIGFRLPVTDATILRIYFAMNVQLYFEIDCDFVEEKSSFSLLAIVLSSF